MQQQSQLGIEWSGATGDQVKRLDAIITEYVAYKLTAYPALKTLCEDAPNFAMAHMLKGYLLLSMGTQATVPGASKSAAHVQTLRDSLTTGEACHLAALLAWARGDLAGACHHWDMITIAQPHDLLAIKLQHFTLFWMGRPEHMRDVINRVMPQWQHGMPGYANLMGMHAFALEELGHFETAERLGRQAAEQDPDDLWAVHAVAHVYEMQGDLQAGIAWLDQPADSWHDRNPFREHLWWHTALFAFEAGSYDQVLSLYDSSVWPDGSSFYLDIQNAASLLARLEFAGVDVGTRWNALASVAQDRKGDHVLLFTEPHYTMAFGRTGQFDQAEQQLQSLCALHIERDDWMGQITRDIALPVCEAITAFYRQDYARVVDLLWPMRYQFQPIGGSHAQRDIFNIFLIEAAIGMQNFALARALLTERTARHHNSHSSQMRLAEVCAALAVAGDSDGHASS